MLIPKEKISQGLSQALDQSHKLQNLSGMLFGKKQYHLSIPFAILSYEETMKGMFLSEKLYKNQGITAETWDDLNHHDFKLKYGIKTQKKFVQQSSEIRITKQLQQLKEWGIDPIVTNKAQFLKTLDESLTDYSYLETLKELCLYSSWDSKNKEWVSFSEFPVPDQQKINLWILRDATYFLLSLHSQIEHIENYFRDRRRKISIFSKYSKSRKPQNYTSVKELRKISRRYLRFKKDYELGKKIMRKRLVNIKI